MDEHYQRRRLVHFFRLCQVLWIGQRDHRRGGKAVPAAIVRHLTDVQVSRSAVFLGLGDADAIPGHGVGQPDLGWSRVAVTELRGGQSL